MLKILWFSACFLVFLFSPVSSQPKPTKPTTTQKPTTEVVFTEEEELYYALLLLTDLSSTALRDMTKDENIKTVVKALFILPDRSIDIGRRERVYNALGSYLSQENISEAVKNYTIHGAKNNEKKLFTDFYHHALYRTERLENSFAAIGKALLPARQLVNIAISIKKTWGNDNWKKYQHINAFTSILCGFYSYELESIDPFEFLLINDEVFNCLWECTRQKLLALLKVASLPQVYGDPQGWTRDVVNNMGFVVTVIQENILQTMQPESFSGMRPSIFKFLNYKAWNMNLTTSQIQYLHSKARTTWLIYNRDTSVFADATSINTLDNFKMFKFNSVFIFVNFLLHL